MNKKNTILLFVPFIIMTMQLNAQINRVLNYSFEKETFCSGIGDCRGGTSVNNWYCPEGFINWFSFPCFGASANQGVPQNDLSYLYARTGECYAGIQPIGARNTVAYITGTLSDSLKATEKYCVTFYVSLADSEWWATNSIGAYFSNDSICTGTYNVLPYTPQVENPATNFLTNKVNWVPVSGEFQASGGEIFITIGGFQNTTPSNTDSVGHGGFVGGENSEVQSYYYVDDVYVRELTIANAGISASLNNQKIDTICVGDTVQIGKDSTTAGVSFYWLPTAGLSNPNIAQPKATPSVTTTYTLTVINDSVLAVNNKGQACNCADSVTKDSVKIVVNRCGLGIQQLSVVSCQLSVEPNPSDGKFSIQWSGFSGQVSVEVFNVLGEEVYSQFNIQHSTFNINLSNQPNGIYLIRVLTKDGGLVGMKKIIKDE